MKRLLLSGLACCALVKADFNPPAWPYRRPLTINAAKTVTEFTVDPALYRDSAANLDDLRIIRNQTEIPYMILKLGGSRRISEPPVAILNKAWVPGTGLQATLDLKGHREHNRLHIGTRLHNFKEAVRVETSDDAQSWAVVTTDALIFDIQRDDHAAAETSISYPTSTRRYVRLTIPGWTEPANLQTVWLSDFKETGAIRDALATLTPAVREDSKAQTSELLLDMGFPGQPIDRADLTVDPGLFSRTVEITAANDPQHWYSRSAGVISRTADEEHLSLTMPESSERYLKITIFNGDNAPLHFGTATLRGVRRVVKFASAQPGGYFVYFGNPNVRPPVYDFQRVIPADDTPAQATIGPLEPNPLFRMPERPWTDRHPSLLNGTLVVAVIAMGLVTLRMLKKIS